MSISAVAIFTTHIQHGSVRMRTIGAPDQTELNARRLHLLAVATRRRGAHIYMKVEKSASADV